MISSASRDICGCSRRSSSSAFPQRILNIHPSLLPAFPGLDAQKQAFDYGVQVAGCTVHFVDEQLDHGVIVLQKTVPVLPGDDAHTLVGAHLEQEHIAYSEAIARVLSGEYRIVGSAVREGLKPAWLIEGLGIRDITMRDCASGFL